MNNFAEIKEYLALCKLTGDPPDSDIESIYRIMIKNKSRLSPSRNVIYEDVQTFSELNDICARFEIKIPVLFISFAISEFNLTEAEFSYYPF